MIGFQYRIAFLFFLTTSFCFGNMKPDFLTGEYPNQEKLSFVMSDFGFFKEKRVSESNQVSECFNKDYVQIYENDGGLGISFEKSDDENGILPYAFDYRFYNGHLYKGDVIGYLRSVEDKLQECGPSVTALDLRNVRLFSANHSLDQSFPNLKYLALSRNTISGPLDAVAVPRQTRALLLEGFGLGADFRSFLAQFERLEFLILKDCWLAVPQALPHMEKHFLKGEEGFFKPIIPSLKFFIAEDCSEMIGLDFISNSFPRLVGLYLDFNTDFIFEGPQAWLPYFEPNSKVALSLPRLKTLYFSFQHFDFDQAHVEAFFFKLVKKHGFEQKSFDQIQGIVSQWLSDTTGPEKGTVD